MSLQNISNKLAHAKTALFAAVAALGAVFVFALSGQQAVADITQITITSPNGGEYLSGTVQITWTCTDDGNSPTCADTTITDILYSPDGGTNWESVGYTGGSLYADAGSFSWDTTSNTEAVNGVIRIVTNNAGKNDESDNPFTVDNTKPSITSVTTNDSDGNGKIDQLIVVFDEDMDQSKTDTTGFSYGSYTLGAQGTWNSATEFVIPVTENTNACSFSDQSGCDTNDTSNVAYTGTGLSDLAGNTPNNYGPTAVTDGAKPAMVGAEVYDSDSNGKIDEIHVRFSEDLNGSSVTAADFSVAGYTVSAANEISQGFVDIDLQEGASYDTWVTPDVAIVTGERIIDNNSVELNYGDPGASITPADKAKPVAVSSYYTNDIDPVTNDKLPNVSSFVIIFSEPLDQFAGSHTDFVSDISVTENHLSGLGNGPATNATITTQGELLVDAPSTAADITGVGSSGNEPTWSYTYDGTNGVADAAGNVWEVSLPAATTMEDQADPFVYAALTINSDTDATADTLELGFTEPMDDSTFTPGDWALSSDGGSSWDAFDVFGTNTTVMGGGSSTSDDEYLSLKISSPGNVSGTDHMDYRYTVGTAPVTDHAGNELAGFSSKAASDNAGPKIKAFAYRDADQDGQIDTIRAYFSEPVDVANSQIAPNDFAFSNVGDFTGAAFGADTTDQLTGSGTATYADLTLGTEATVKDTRDDSGNLAISAQNNVQLQDDAVAGNQSTAADVVASNVAYLDEAGPVIVDAKTYVGNGQGQTTGAQVTYSEDISNASTNTADYRFINKHTSQDVDLVSVSVNSTDNSKLDFTLDANDTDNYTGVFTLQQDATKVVDLSNNQLQNPYISWDLDDLVSPVVIGFVADPNPAGIGDNLTFTVTFSEPMDTTTNIGSPEFDTTPAAGPYAVNGSFNSTNTEKWEGAYTNNPIKVSVPVSGTHTFTAVWSNAADPAGNAALPTTATGVTFDFDIDSEYPETTGLEVTPANPGLNVPVTVTATVNDDVAPQGAELFIEVGGNTVPLGAMTESQTSNNGKTKTYTKTIVPSAISGVVAGNTYNVYVRGKDAVNTEPLDKDNDGVNDINTETLQVSADNTNPTVTISGEGTTVTVDADTYTISGSVNDTNFKTVKVFRMVGSTPSSNDVQVGFYAFGPSEKNWSVVVQLPQNQTTKYYAEAHDLSLNSARSGILTIVEQTDTTAPTISNVQVQNITQTSATITWNTDENATSEVEYGTTASYGHKTAADTTADTQSHSVTISTGLACGTTYHFRVISRDATGNEAVSVDATFTTSPCVVDTTPPTITITSTAANKTSATVWFDSSEAGQVRANYGTTSNYGNITAWQTLNAGSNQSVTFGGLSCGTTYHFSIEARDAAGNTSQTADSTITTAACDDTTPPSFTTSFTNIVSAGFDITVSANEPFDFMVEIDDDPTFASIDETLPYSATVQSNPQTKTAANLTAGTTYYVRVTVKDAAGNTSTQVYVQQTAPGGAVNIQSLKVTDVTDTAATIAWSTDVQPDTAEYRISTIAYDGTWTAMSATANNGTQALSGLQPNTDYYYQVRFLKNGQYTTSVPMRFRTAAASTGIAVESIQAVKTYAVADDTYTNGWKWIFNITINNLAETDLAMKFDRWVSGTNGIDAGGNMRYSIDDATWTDVTANNAYPATFIDVSGVDLDPSRGGRQVKVYVEMKVPNGTPGGSYSTSYGIKTQ